MALLRHSVFLIAMFLIPSVSPFRASDSRADTVPFVSGAEVSVNGSAGPGQVYSFGQSVQLLLGNSEDRSNHSGDIHFKSTRQFSPEDPSVTTSGIKHADSLVGGFSIDLWKDVFVGLELDSLQDDFAQVNADGAKIMMGVDPIHFSYRHGRTVIHTPFQVVQAAPKPPRDFDGAFIYQDTFTLDAAMDITRIDSLGLEVSYSLFHPDAKKFSSIPLLNQANLGTLGNFKDSLENFESASASPNWRHHFGKSWDSNVSFNFAHLILIGNNLFESTVEVGWKASKTLRLQLGWNYTHSSIDHQNLATFELKYNWDR